MKKERLFVQTTDYRRVGFFALDAVLVITAIVSRNMGDDAAGRGVALTFGLVGLAFVLAGGAGLYFSSRAHSWPGAIGSIIPLAVPFMLFFGADVESYVRKIRSGFDSRKEGRYPEPAQRELGKAITAGDFEAMRKILAASGAPIENSGRILDLGCAGGRMIRHLADLVSHMEVWGCDIWADAIMWCQENLSPPFWFATTTVVPHLPFEDRSFGLVYCGSLFTHIDDLADAWFLELHRIIRPGGRLVFSINDRHAVSVFSGDADPAAYARYWERTGGREVWDGFTGRISTDPDYQRFRDGDAWMVSMGRDGMSHVMWDADALCRRL